MESLPSENLRFPNLTMESLHDTIEFRPQRVLVIKKLEDDEVNEHFVDVLLWFIRKEIVVVVESGVLQETLLAKEFQYQKILHKLVPFHSDMATNNRIDLVVSAGGDGALLHAASLFQEIVPPVVSFKLGPGGILSAFDLEEFETQIKKVFEGNASSTLRSRLRCSFLHQTQSGISETEIVVLNELVIDRGPSPIMSNLDLYMDGRLVTSVQGDGLIVSTPTGSTAYALAAGSCMIHSSVPAIMLTPICPHSLSFRPIIVPAATEIKLCISPGSPYTAWIAFDGKSRQEIKSGDSLIITTSEYPVNCIGPANEHISNWFSSLAECFHWNVRKSQLCFDMGLEEDIDLNRNIYISRIRSYDQNCAKIDKRDEPV